jgi:hypothetical protein
LLCPMGWMCYKRRSKARVRSQDGTAGIAQVTGADGGSGNELASGRSRERRRCGVCQELLPAVFSASFGAKLQVDLSGLRLLHVLLGFLLRRSTGVSQPARLLPHPETRKQFQIV